MEINDLPFFKLVGRRMDWLVARQKVLAQNVANADTPNYRTRDLKPMAFDDLLRVARNDGIASLSPTRTNVAHLGAAGARGGAPQEVVEPPDNADFSLSGNTVDMEDQLMKVAQTDMDYQVATNLYRKYLGLFRTALGRGGAVG